MYAQRYKEREMERHVYELILFVSYFSVYSKTKPQNIIYVNIDKIDCVCMYICERA